MDLYPYQRAAPPSLRSPVLIQSPTDELETDFLLTAPGFEGHVPKPLRDRLGQAQRHADHGHYGRWVWRDGGRMHLPRHDQPCPLPCPASRAPAAAAAVLVAAQIQLACSSRSIQRFRLTSPHPADLSPWRHPCGQRRYHPLRFQTALPNRFSFFSSLDLR
jgi:hypothetical protein